MNAFEDLQLERSEFGPEPKFRNEDVFRALCVLKERRASRKKLADDLGIGEGSARSIIAFLEGKKVAATMKKGCLLTDRGFKMIAELKKTVGACGSISKSEITFGKKAYALVVRGGAKKTRFGTEQRDCALKAGADGATVLVVKGGKMFFPRESFEAPAKIEREIRKLGVLEDDAIVLSYGIAQRDAERGAWAAALTLV